MTALGLARRVRATDVLASALLCGMFASGVFAYDAVPAQVVVHYTPPGGVYYGPETLPKAVGLFAVPAVAAVTFGVARLLPSIAGGNDELTAFGPYYRVALVLLVAVLAGAQVALVLWNAV